MKFGELAENLKNGEKIKRVGWRESHYAQVKNTLRKRSTRTKKLFPLKEADLAADDWVLVEEKKDNPQTP